MTKNLLRLAAFLCFVTSCSKSVNDKVEDKGGLVEFISVNPTTNDSSTVNYSFEAGGYLTKQWIDSKFPALYPVKEYTRDEEKRIIKITSFGPGDTLIRTVYYATGNEVAYSVQYSTRDASKLTDSVTYEYESGKVNRINMFLAAQINSEHPSYYFTYEYAYSNISKIHSFWLNDDGTYRSSLGFDLEYDDKINPLFSPDDIFLGISGFGFDIYASPNNVIRQTNDYGGGYTDYVVSDYTYGGDNKPISVVWSGPGITTMNGFYFYK